MGTLRIKRGTKNQLQVSPGYTPAEGELVYTTDSKEVFVGDGATVGGTPVSVSTQNIEDLGNVQALAAQKDQILVYNGSNWAATDNPSLDLRGNIYGDDSTLLVDAINGQIVGPINTTSIVSSGNIVGDVVGDVTGSVTGNVVGDTTGTHFGNVSGNVTGSVFSNDSTLLVDGENATLNGQLFTDSIETTTTGTNRAIMSYHYGDDRTDAANIRQHRAQGTEALPTVVTNNDQLGKTSFEGYDGTSFQTAAQIIGAVRGTVSTGAVPGKISFLCADEAGTLNKIAECRGPTEEFVVTNILSVDGLIKSNAGAEFRAGLSGDLTGSVFSDTSTLLIDAVNGAISVANADLVGTVDDGTGVGSLSGYLQVTVNGTTKFIPLYDPA